MCKIWLLGALKRREKSIPKRLLPKGIKNSGFQFNLWLSTSWPLNRWAETDVILLVLNRETFTFNLFRSSSLGLIATWKIQEHKGKSYGRSWITLGVLSSQNDSRLSLFPTWVIISAPHERVFKIWNPEIKPWATRTSGGLRGAKPLLTCFRSPCGLRRVSCRPHNESMLRSYFLLRFLNVWVPQVVFLSAPVPTLALNFWCASVKS